MSRRVRRGIMYYSEAEAVFVGPSAPNLPTYLPTRGNTEPESHGLYTALPGYTELGKDIPVVDVHLLLVVATPQARERASTGLVQSGCNPRPTMEPGITHSSGHATMLNRSADSGSR
ncbi:hypothetical protein EXIGLDRAFT_716579 [Exidia glandulosa HHB12029]|uniref:Uncharacterized protein n=1 Tax=Exidia glandulosa HHB12029 TaxID=1314781 RepID=A0A165IVX6_EXIGL|nr:hypothetical protein EXIGLDRAFT_716579 [Exidia glandulosa HHB12029]